MYYFIDDMRPNPKPDKYNKFKTVEEAIKMMSILKPKYVSTDYDLGPDKMDGLDLLKWMFENDIEPESINIHSDHTTGKKEMLKYAKEHFKNTDITTNPL